MATKKNENIDFESAMLRINEITAKLEDTTLKLDDSLKLYEEGVGLAQRCASELEDAKRRIKILQQGKDGEIELADVPEGTFNS